MFVIKTMRTTLISLNIIITSLSTTSYKTRTTADVIHKTAVTADARSFRILKFLKVFLNCFNIIRLISLFYFLFPLQVARLDIYFIELDGNALV